MAAVQRCNYWYGPEHRCKVHGRFLNKRGMCPQHNLLEQRKADKKKWAAKQPNTIAEGRKSRAKPEHEKVKKKPQQSGLEYYDHTAPWTCGQVECTVCTNKPTYNQYMKKKFG